MKRVVWVTILFVFPLAILIGLVEKAAISGQVRPKSECISCHTDVKGLIRLCWEVEKVKPKPAQSEETSGEG